MNQEHVITTDALVIGSGMGGMTIASLLARDGLNPIVLEAAHVPGGCSSSFKRKGYVFESGATTLIGFDTHQPLARLESMLGITIPKTLISPGMSVHIDGKKCIRYQDREAWIAEAGRVFWQSGRTALILEPCFRGCRYGLEGLIAKHHLPPTARGGLAQAGGTQLAAGCSRTAIRPEIRGPGDAGLRR